MTWQRLYQVLLAVLLVAAISGGVTFLVRRSAPPGVEVLIPTPTPTEETRAYISGAVGSPGVYTVPAEGRLADLIELAGGAVEGADLDAVNLAQRVRDQDHFHIPRIGEVTPLAQPDPGRIDINTASLEQLDTLPGIGEVKAKAIVYYRELNGPFETIDELMNVEGIGPATYEKLCDLITVGGR